jgi:hypothetical protein
VYPDLAQRCLARGGRVESDLLPRATEVLMLGLVAAEGGQWLPPEAALPVYVRERVAEPAPSSK